MSSPHTSETALTSAVARQLAARYSGSYQVILEPGAAGPYRFESRDGKPSRSGVRLVVTAVDGRAKGERLEFMLALDGVPRFVAGRSADIIDNLAAATDAEGETPAELINAAARRLCPTAKNRTPPAVTATVSARIVEGRARPYLDLVALAVSK